MIIDSENNFKDRHSKTLTRRSDLIQLRWVVIYNLWAPQFQGFHVAQVKLSQGFSENIWSHDVTCALLYCSWWVHLGFWHSNILVSGSGRPPTHQACKWNLSGSLQVWSLVFFCLSKESRSIIRASPNLFLGWCPTLQKKKKRKKGRKQLLKKLWQSFFGKIAWKGLKFEKEFIQVNKSSHHGL